MEKGSPKIHKLELVHFLQSLNDGFTFACAEDPRFNRIRVYHKGKYMGAFSKDYVPRHDEINGQGSVIRRGYQHMLVMIYESAKNKLIYLSNDAMRTLYTLLKRLGHFKNPVDYFKVVTDEEKEVERKKQYLWNQYGVKISDASIDYAS